MVRTRSGRGGEIQTPTMKANSGVVRRGRGRPPSVRTVGNPVIPIEVANNPMVSTTAAVPNNQSADAGNQPSTPITIDLIDETPPPADQLQPLLTSTDFDDSITYIGTTKMHHHQQQRRSVEIIFPVIAELEAERDEHAEKRKLCQRSIASKSRIACPICFDDISIIDQEPDRQLMSTMCGHIFCSTCIDGVLLKSKNTAAECPQCRKRIARADVHPIFL